MEEISDPPPAPAEERIETEEISMTDFVIPVEPRKPRKSATPTPTLSPTKRLNARLMEESIIPPESPDMKLARDRLGVLLSSIKKGELYPPPDPKRPGGGGDDDDVRRGPGRPRKVRVATKDKQVVFELRGKPFSLEDGRTDSMYQLGRAWIRGKQEDYPPPVIPAPPANDFALDLLATRDIYSLPRARSPYQIEEAWPKKENIDEFNKEIDVEDMDELRKEYARHWKKVKVQWKQHMRTRAKRYHRSTKLLNTIFSLAQNTHDTL